MMDKVGTNYRPDCLQDCGMARLCRGRAHDLGLVTLSGSAVARYLPGVRTLDRAADLAAGVPAAASEAYSAAALMRANAIYEQVLAKGEL